MVHEKPGWFVGIKCVDDTLVCSDPDTLYMLFVLSYFWIFAGCLCFCCQWKLYVFCFCLCGSYFCFLCFDLFYGIAIFVFSFVRWFDAYTPQNVMHRFGLLQSQNTPTMRKDLLLYSWTGVKQPNPADRRQAAKWYVSNWYRHCFFDRVFQNMFCPQKCCAPSIRSGSVHLCGTAHLHTVTASGVRWQRAPGNKVSSSVFTSASSTCFILTAKKGKPFFTH